MGVPILANAADSVGVVVDDRDEWHSTFTELPLVLGYTPVDSTRYRVGVTSWMVGS